MSIDKLTLIIGADLVIPETPVKIHQPTINEIALIGEERFFYSLNGFTINIDRIKRTIEEKTEDEEKAKVLVSNIDEYIVLLQYLQSDEGLRANFTNLCNLLLINYEIQLLQGNLFMRSLDEKQFPSFQCDLNFFLKFKDTVQQIFKLNKIIEQSSLNPKGKLAEKIASKMQQTRAKIEKMNGTKEIDILSHYVSILSIGTNALNISTIKDLTIYQLYDQLERYNLYSQYENSLQAALAGAKVDIVDWLKKI